MREDLGSSLFLQKLAGCKRRTEIPFLLSSLGTVCVHGLVTSFGCRVVLRLSAARGYLDTVFRRVAGKLSLNTVTHDETGSLQRKV